MRILIVTIILILTLVERGAAGSAIIWSGPQNIKMGPGASVDWLPSNAWWYLDINLDGVNDLRFEYIQDFTVQTQNGSKVTATPQPPYSILDAVPLPGGTVIGGSSTWGDSTFPLVDWESVPGFGLIGVGSWAWISNEYLGVSITLADGVHYGWVQVSSYDTMGAVIHDWAFESQPGVGIEAGVVPEPSTLGLCVIGVLSILVYRLRRRRSAIFTHGFGGRCKNIIPDDVCNNIG